MFPVIAILILTAAVSQDEGYATRVPDVTDFIDETSSVPLELSTGHPIVEVEIQGEGPFRMLLDTGAMATAIDADLAEELGLAVVGQTTLGDPSNPAAHTANLVEVEELAIGDVVFYDFEAVAWDRPEALRRSTTDGSSTRGIVGLPLFAGCLMTLDYQNAQLSLSEGELPEPDGKQVLATSRTPEGIILFPIEVAGTSMQAHLDSGNPQTLLLPGRFEEMMPLVEGSKRTGRGMRASGPVEFTVARLDGDLHIGDLILARPEIRFDEKITGANLGFSMLKGRRLTLDQKNHRMQLSSGE